MPASPPLHHLPADNTPTPPPPSPSAAMLAEAFDLGRPIEPLVHHRHGAQETWTLGTMAGRFLVKRLWTGPDPTWRPDLERAMAFEQRACQAGIDMPRPIEPLQPAFGYAARVHAFGIFRVHEWLDHRPVGPEDDLAEWLGSTLGRLHQIEVLSDVPEPQWYGIYPPVRWHAWLAEGEAQGKLWAPVLRERLAEILDLTRWIGEVFAAAGSYVVTHRDVEPWNILVTGSGPRLIDWDASGPDSAPLEAAHAFLAFASTHRAEPDATMLKRALSAYREAGGGPIEAGRDMIVRRVGLRLHRLSERLAVTLGLGEYGSIEPVQAEVRAREQIEDLPRLVATLTRWSELLRG